MPTTESDRIHTHYATRDAERAAAHDALEAARGPICDEPGCKGPIWHQSKPRVRCPKCKGQGRLQVADREEIRRLERAYDAACVVGD